MNILKTEISEVLIIEPKLFGDSRGFFTELYQADRYDKHGIPGAICSGQFLTIGARRLAGAAYSEPKSAGKAGHCGARGRDRRGGRCPNWQSKLRSTRQGRIE